MLGLDDVVLEYLQGGHPFLRLLAGLLGLAALLSLAGSGSRVELLAEGDSRGADAEPDKLVRYAAVGVWRTGGGGLLAD